MIEYLKLREGTIGSDNIYWVRLENNRQAPYGDFFVDLCEIRDKVWMYISKYTKIQIHDIHIPDLEQEAILVERVQNAD